jgi:hypothetical protein
MKFKILSISLLIIVLSFPSICFSKSKTVEYEHCGIYLGDMKNKKELNDFRQGEKTTSIILGLLTLTDPSKNRIKLECIRHIHINYLERVVVVSHTEKGRNICNKVKITFDPEVVDEYLSQENCIVPNLWFEEIDFVLTKKSDKINIGLIIQTKIPDIEESKREQLENEEERQFFKMTEENKDKYKVVDRRHLSKILEEQKLSSSGITDSETVKVGKILNLDIIVLRILYDKSQVTKVLKVDTGEVLLFRTYETKKEEGWIYYGNSKTGDRYYDNRSMTYVRQNVIKVWDKVYFSKPGKEDEIQSRKRNKLPIDGWDKLNFEIVLWEVDCVNNISKVIKIVDYDDQGKMLYDYDYPDPKMTDILPETVSDFLRREVCPK